MANCPACRDHRTHQRDPLCQQCMSAARQLAPRPQWVLDSLLLRRVLARQDLAAVPAVVRAACGLPQRDLAAIAGWSADALGAYERGFRSGLFDIRTLLPFADAIAMPRQALQPLFLGDPDAGIPSNLDATLPSASLPSAAFGAPRHGPAPVMPAGGGQDCGARARYWHACTGVLHRNDRQAGGAALLRPAILLWSHARRVCLHAASGVALLAAGGGIALYAARAALDAGAVPLAWSLHQEATNLAEAASDVTLTVQALLVGSQLHAQAARDNGNRKLARQAMALVRRAAEEGRYEPVPRLHAQIAVRHAEAAALLGDPVAFGAAITRARRELARPAPPPAGAVPAWLTCFSPDDITTAEADGTVALGDTVRAAMLYRESARHAPCPRDKTDRDALDR
jgi:hypothetical protein